MNACLLPRLITLVLIGSAISHCASVPTGRHGVTSLEIRGMNQLDDAALKACLATSERATFSLDLGSNPSPECNIPPFDADRISVGLWRWPWTDWPLFDRTLFERDLQRIVRWYRARGYYKARILDTNVQPASAMASTPDLSLDDPTLSALDAEPDPYARIRISIFEGDPIIVESTSLSGDAQLPLPLRKELHGQIGRMVGERFDEADYDTHKRVLLRILHDASYAHAEVGGSVRINTRKQTAAVALTIHSGPPCFFGNVTVDADKRHDLPISTILGAADIRTGRPFSLTVLEEARREIYSLGAFSSVEIVPDMAEKDTTIDVRIRLSPGRLFRYGVGLGILSGVTANSAIQEQQDALQWDIHLLGFVEFRNFFGGLRRLRIEERPRLIFTRNFPFADSDDPVLGNLLITEFQQPGFLESRTTLASGVRWDLGPQPFGENFMRHDVDAWIGPQRFFLKGRLFAVARIHTNVFFPIRIGPDVAEQPSPYEVLFFEQFIRWDLRDRPRQPRKGAFFALGLHEAIPPGSWTYLRVTPDARVYLPLPLGFTLAARFAVGIMEIFETDFDEGINPRLARLGPDTYRLRGGGATSVRGFLPGHLGDGIFGGVRRWESSLELRMPVTEKFETVVFADAGDVSAARRFRFDHPQTTVGLGFRYHTIIGPIRFDAGWRVPGAQVLGEDQRDPNRQGRPDQADLGLFSFPGALHLTIGETF